jgi:HPt (histidine-containing phosphotransfer) domain-containing protein
MAVDDADSAESEFQAQLAALRRTYLQGMPARRAALDEAWQACTEAGADGPWEQLRGVAHKLSGSASSYGFEALGVAARELDKLLSGQVACRERARAEPLVARLHAALDAAIASA